MDNRVFKKVMSANGTVYQYQNQTVVNKNQNQIHTLRHLPETSSHVVDCVTIAKSDEPNEKFKMINNNKTSLNFTNNSTNYKRNDFRQCYDLTEASGEGISAFLTKLTYFLLSTYSPYMKYILMCFSSSFQFLDFAMSLLSF